jgi:hypothetical protein
MLTKLRMVCMKQPFWLVVCTNQPKLEVYA